MFKRLKIAKRSGRKEASRMGREDTPKGRQRFFSLDTLTLSRFDSVMDDISLHQIQEQLEMLREDSVIGDKSFQFEDTPTTASESGRPSLTSVNGFPGFQNFDNLFDPRDSPSLSDRVDSAAEHSEWQRFPCGNPEGTLK